MRRILLTGILLVLMLINVAWDGIEPPCTRVDGIEICFTVPGSDNAPIEDELIRLIDEADTSLDIAIYEFDLVPVEQMLLKAMSRDVDIRIVTDTDSIEDEDSVLSNLIAAGIPVVGDGRHYLMHNKFMVVDRKTVWTGSYNWTENGTYRNNNNVVIIESVELAKIYTEQFDTMFAGIFNRRDDESTLHTVQVFGVEIGVCFMPESNCEQYIIDELRNANESVKFMAFSFTDDDIGDELISLYQRGIYVSGVFETLGSATPSSEFSRFSELNMNVMTDKNKGLLHHKVMIIDDNVVITGSGNFSANASRNNENILFIKDGHVADSYLIVFEKLK